MITLCLLQNIPGAAAAVAPAGYPDIPIYVEETWSVPYAADIQDISFNWNSNTLLLRSNGSGKIFLADPATCDSLGEVSLPAGSEGFGVAVSFEGSVEYYINSSTSSDIMHSDGSGSWAAFTNPSGACGTGMDMFNMGSAFICEASDTTPFLIYGMEPDGSWSEQYTLPGVVDEVSGFMGHEVYTDYGSPPSACILTTRFGHEFFFAYENGGGYTLYGQEPCPVTVSESLGLTWSSSDKVYWSYKGQDGNYYVSRLVIPVFGGIGSEYSQELSGPENALGIVNNPSEISACLTIDLPNSVSASLDVFDVTGRLMQTLHNGQLTPDANSFSFTGSSGVYTAVLRYAGQEEKLRFVITR